VNYFKPVIFSSPKSFKYPPELLIWKGESVTNTQQALTDVLNIINQISDEDFNRINLQSKFYTFIDNHLEYQGNRGKLLWPLRVALSGKQASAGPFEIAEVLGKKESLRRIKEAINKLEA